MRTQVKRFFTIRNGRRLTQALFLLLFLFLFIQTESKGNDELGYPVRLFLDFDPLIFVATLLSAHAVAGAFLLSLITIVATILLGRVFCGWVCPLGTLNNLAGSFKRKPPARDFPGLHRAKYYLLIAILASALFTLQPAGIMDPLSLIIRSFSISIYPLFNHGIRSFFDAIYSADPLRIAAVTEPVYSALKKTVLSFEQPLYRQSFFIGILFLAVLGLNLVEKRFWCKYLCPLGAFLGLLSRQSLLRRSVSEGCTSCGACSAVCQGNALPGSGETWLAAECLECRNCDDVCPGNAVHFGFS